MPCKGKKCHVGGSLMGYLPSREAHVEPGGRVGWKGGCGEGEGSKSPTGCELYAFSISPSSHHYSLSFCSHLPLVSHPPLCPQVNPPKAQLQCHNCSWHLQSLSSGYHSKLFTDVLTNLICSTGRYHYYTPVTMWRLRPQELACLRS